MNRGYLEHHGIKGQKWGVRRYQNEDGSLTAAGRRKEKRDIKKAIKKETNFVERSLFNNATRKKALNYVQKNNMTVKEATAKANKDAIRNTAIMLGVIGGMAVATAAVANNVITRGVGR